MVKNKLKNNVELYTRYGVNQVPFNSFFMLYGIIKKNYSQVS